MRQQFVLLIGSHRTPDRHAKSVTRPRVLLALSMTLAMSLGACGATEVSTHEPIISTQTPAVVPPASPTPRLGPSAEEMASARRFRATFGLRSDDAWISAVFGDPSSDGGQAFGVPLLPAEAAKVIDQQTRANGITDIIAAYGATVPRDWVGLYVDQQAGGTVVASFKANLAEHQAALLALLPGGAKFEVREATWSQAELRGFLTVVERERGWFPTIGTTYKTAYIGGLDHPGGIDLEFAGPAAAASAIEAHYGNPPWLRAVWAGPGEWTGARGDLVVRTTDAAGRPVPHLEIDLVSEDERVDGNQGYGMGTGENGRMRQNNLAAVTYRVIAYEGEEDDRVAVAEARVRVPANGSITVRLIVR